jgi:hypothetical protein
MTSVHCKYKPNDDVDNSETIVIVVYDSTNILSLIESRVVGAKSKLWIEFSIPHLELPDGDLASALINQISVRCSYNANVCIIYYK